MSGIYRGRRLVLYILLAISIATLVGYFCKVHSLIMTLIDIKMLLI